VTGPFKSPLEIFVYSRRIRGTRTFAGMTVKVSEKSVVVLLEFDQQIVSRGHVGDDTEPAAPLVREFDVLVEDVDTVNFGPGDEKELLIHVGREFFETVVKEQRTNGITSRVAGLPSIFFDNPIKARQKLIGSSDFHAYARSVLAGASGGVEPADLLFAFLDQCLFLFVDVTGLHLWYASAIRRSMVRIPELTSFGRFAICTRNQSSLRGAKQAQWLWLRICGEGLRR
jgi:hypothetical protein